MITIIMIAVIINITIAMIIILIMIKLIMYIMIMIIGPRGRDEVGKYAVTGECREVGGGVLS